MARLAVLCCAAVFAAAAHAAPPPDEVESVVRELFTAYAGGDLTTVSRLWDGELPKKTALTMRARCMRLDSLRLFPRQVTGESAVVDAEAAITSWSVVETPHERQEKELRTVCLRRGGEGWKVVRWDRQEDIFLSRFDAIDRVEQEHALRSAPRTPAMAVRLVERAILEINRDEIEAARRLIDLAAEIAAESGDVRAMAAALEGESTYLRVPRHQNIEASADAASESLLYAEASGDADAIARALLRLGRASRAHDAHSRALFRRALSLADQVTDLSVLARTATQLGEDASSMGKFRDDMRYALIAARYAELGDDAAGKLAAEMSIAGAYFAQVDMELAGMHFERARVMARELGFPNAERSMLQQLASVHESLGDEKTAGARRDEALSIVLEKSCDHSAAAALLRDRARVAIWRSDFAAANRDLMHSFREVDEGAPYTGPQFDGNMILYAELLWQQGHTEEALRIAGRYDTPDALIQVAAALRRLGRTQEARSVLERVIDDSENARTEVFGTERQHALFLGRFVDVYLSLVDILVGLGEPEQAFRTAQRLKARVLREVLGRDNAARVVTDRGTVDLEERQLAGEIAQLNLSLLGARERERIRAIREELARVRFELQDLAGRKTVSHPDHTILSTQTAAQIDLAEVLGRAVVVDYAVGRDATTIFVVTRGPGGGPRVVAHTVRISRSALAGRVRELRTALEQRNLQYGALSASMYDLLLAPVEKEIADAPLVCILPAGALWNVPFHALRDRHGRYVAERTTVFYAPSTAVLAEMLRRDPPSQTRGAPTLLAFANPNIRGTTAAQFRTFYERAELGAIPEAEEEVRNLGRLYGPRRSRIYIGDEARESVLKQEAGSSDILHVASHGLIDDGAPMFSALLLSKAPDEESEDGLLEAREISGLRPGTRIAVLSACETGKGQISQGEGVIGLSWAFLANGCPTAVVSQWKAVSTTTATLMVDFHRNLLGGSDAAHALQKAQLALMRDERFSHPFYWAPFVVVGAP